MNDIKNRSREKFSFLALIIDLVKLAIFLLVIYSVYLGGILTYNYLNIKETTDILSRYASTSIDNSKIKNMMKSYCQEKKEIDCIGKSFKIQRTFGYAKISIKYNFRVKLFWLYPIEITFEPESKEVIPVFTL